MKKFREYLLSAKTVIYFICKNIYYSSFFMLFDMYIHVKNLYIDDETGQFTQGFIFKINDPVILSDSGVKEKFLFLPQ